MLLRETLDLDRTTQEIIHRLQRMQNTWEITPEQYEDQYEHVMDSHRMRWEAIMSHNIINYHD
jgi:hypothetical protein